MNEIIKELKTIILNNDLTLQEQIEVVNETIRNLENGYFESSCELTTQEIINSLYEFKNELNK